tara:strand:+ start:19786 stop:20577 length:792 start_codon:yes stop_codon:yes gene_type:complete
MLTKLTPFRLVVLFCFLGSGPTWADTEGDDDAVVVVHMVGDSTMANKSKPDINPEHGWGQVMGDYVESGVVVKNYAAGGRSTRSFIAEGRWDRVLENLKPGDWVIIQFGHNDQKKKKPALYTDPKTDYQEFLVKFIEESRAHGAQPILATSIYRRYFRNGAPKDTLGGYPDATLEVAETMGVPVVDLHALTGELLAEEGEEGSKDLFLHFEPGEDPFYPNGKSDNSHLSEEGARAVAILFAEYILDQEVGFPAVVPPVAPEDN